jgi:hypothetical protein
MLTKTLDGIPFLVDPVSKLIYAYEKVPTQPLLALGTYIPQTPSQKEGFTLYPNWKELYEPRLQTYRASEKPKQRAQGK